MNVYAEAHPICEFDGKTVKTHVHHIIPISEAPELAADKSNMISLGAKRTHLAVGHANNYKHHVENVRELCETARINRD